MKTFRSVLIIIVVLGVAAAVLKFADKKHAPVADNPTSTQNPSTPSPIDLSPEVNVAQLCYIWNTEAGDKAMISMDIRGDNVLGEFNFVPAEKDSKVGIFKGTVTPVDQKTMSRTVNAWWETKGEGMTATEELKIIFGEGTANPGFGEMKDRGDGVYVYANPAKIDYSLNLQQTDCGDSAMD